MSGRGAEADGVEHAAATRRLPLPSILFRREKIRLVVRPSPYRQAASEHRGPGSSSERGMLGRSHGETG